MSAISPYKRALVSVLVILLVYRVIWISTPTVENVERKAKVNGTSAILASTNDNDLSSNNDGTAKVTSISPTDGPITLEAPSTAPLPSPSPRASRSDMMERHYPLYDAKLTSEPILDYLERELSKIDEQHLGNTTLFQRQHCDLQGQPWCPSGKKKWQKHAPYFMVAGVKKAGSTSLYYALLEHPQIVTPQLKESLFFTQKRFKYDNYLSAAAKDRSPRDRHYLNTTHKVKVASIRDDYTKKFRVVPLIKDPNSISFDATPQYLFNFPTVPKKILCACPWVKLIVILRDPVDRLWSHFNFIKNLQIKKNKARGPMKTSFEEWVLKDLKRMEKYKLLAPTGLPSEFHPPMQENNVMKAWHDYAADFEEAPVGRGFYALQIYQWMKELRAFGRDPKHVLKVIRLEDLKRKDNNQTVATRILQEITDWLMLERKTQSSKQDKHDEAVDFSQGFRQRFETNYEKLGNPILSQRTREWLNSFYAPHNQMMGRLLGDDGWDYSVNSTGDNFKAMVWPPKDETNGAGNNFFFPSKLEDAIDNDPCYHYPYYNK